MDDIRAMLNNYRIVLYVSFDTNDRDNLLLELGGIGFSVEHVRN